jgi:uncharacterized membrane protein
MTYQQWEKRLSRALKALPQEEREDLIAYYKELYGDKIEAGNSPEEILQEFGNPEICAEKILQENGVQRRTRRMKKSIGWWIGMSLLTLLIILPVSVSIFSVVLSFAVTALACAAVAVVGLLYVIAAPIFANGMNVYAVLAHIGAGFITAGIASLLALGLAYATKSSFKWTIKSLIYIYRGKKNG